MPNSNVELDKKRIIKLTGLSKINQIEWLAPKHSRLQKVVFAASFKNWKVYLYGICQKWANKSRETDKIHATKRKKLRLAKIDAFNKVDFLSKIYVVSNQGPC